MELDPLSLAQPDRYRLLIGAVVPRPIALVSTISTEGKNNLAPFSFFNGVGSDPMMLLFCPVNRADGSEKDSLRNAQPQSEGGVGEFVVNLAVEPYIQRVAGAAEPLPYGESEFDLVGLTPIPSRIVRPPRVAESPVAFECRTEQVIRTGRGLPTAGNIVLGRVVHIYVRDDLINARYQIDPERLQAVGRMGGLVYSRTRDRFELPMGRAALELGEEKPPPRAGV